MCTATMGKIYQVFTGSDEKCELNPGSLKSGYSEAAIKAEHNYRTVKSLVIYTILPKVYRHANDY